MMHSDTNLNAYIDHTYLKPNATLADIKRVCEEARTYNFATVCIPPFYVKAAYEYLKETPVRVCTVIGFPLGYQKTNVKALETKTAITDGASEIDMVLNISALKNHDDNCVRADIAEVVQAAQGQVVKVILETCLLTAEEIQRACVLCMEAGADYVKTSTGFSQHGATIEAVKLMKATIGDHLKIKASGGIKSQEQALEYIELGVSRLGTSSGVELVKGQQTKENY